MDKDEVLKYLQQKYPEDLSKDYKCYWWYMQSLDQNKVPTGDIIYYVCLKDKLFSTEESNGRTVLVKGSKNPDMLECLLKLFLEV